MYIIILFSINLLKIAFYLSNYIKSIHTGQSTILDRFWFFEKDSKF
jgi:hypothetical protein